MEQSLIIQLVTPIGLMIIMFGVGLSLTVNDFSRVAKTPRAVFIGLLGQHLLLPATAFFICTTFVSRADLAIGFMLLAACPGGVTSNLITLLARGDLALSITLTAISSVIGFLTVPAIVGLAYLYFGGAYESIDFPIAKTAVALLILTIFPVAAGMVTRHYRSVWALKAEPFIGRFALCFLIFLIISVSIEQRSVLVSAIFSVGLAVSVLNVTTMSAGALMARIFKLDDKQSTSICLEVGIQNSALAMVLATTVLADSAMAIPAAIYSLVMYVTGSCVVLYRN